MTKRAEAGLETRRKLLDASIRLFAKQGFAQTTLQEIVDESGLTKGAFYHYFGSKDDVLLEIHDTFIESLLSKTYDVLALGLGHQETLRHLIVDMLLSFEEYHDEVSIFFRDHRYLSPESSALVRTKRDQYEAILIRVLNQGIQAGDFRPLANVRIVGFGIVGMCAWAYEWYDPAKDVSAREVAEMYSEIVLDGLTPAKGPESARLSSTAGP